MGPVSGGKLLALTKWLLLHAAAMATGGHKVKLQLVGVRWVTGMLKKLGKPSYKKFSDRTRRMAMARAWHKCERCGTPEELTLHHVNGHHNNSLQNAMVLCKTCHFWKHHTRRRHHK